MNKYDYQIVVGIDIGLRGGLAFYDVQSEELLSLYEMPIKKVTKGDKEKNVIDLDRLAHILEIPKVHKDGCLLVFEDVHAFPGQGVVATATLMEQKGFLRGLASGLNYGVELVQPKAWQKFFDIVPPKDLKGETAKKTKALRKKWLKDKSLELARQKFPECETKLSRNDADGLSDALLIGRWFLSHEVEEAPLDNLGEE